MLSITLSTPSTSDWPMGKVRLSSRMTDFTSCGAGREVCVAGEGVCVVGRDVCVAGRQGGLHGGQGGLRGGQGGWVQQDQGLLA